MEESDYKGLRLWYSKKNPGTPGRTGMNYSEN